MKHEFSGENDATRWRPEPRFDVANRRPESQNEPSEANECTRRAALFDLQQAVEETKAKASRTTVAVRRFKARVVSLSLRSQELRREQ